MIKPVVIIVAGATVGLFFLILKPTFEVITEMRAEEQRVLETVEQFREAAKEIERLQSTYQGVSRQDLDRLGRFLPQGFDQAEFLLYVHRIASNYGLVITGFQFNNNKNKNESSFFETTELRFDVDAPYPVFVALMKDLERSLRPLDIVSIDFSSGEEDRYNFNVTLQTYWVQ